ncbi:MAG: membrane protein insertase YidC [Clostridia bacterium]|nr:membrane protein insertase YidC [Clostridia bacterium]
MDIMYYVCIPFGFVMKLCWQLVSNYGLAILLFTIATKVILLPVSVWIQKNSILMVKIQPEINFLKARLSGNIDAIAEEQSKLFKREKYHPMLSLVPLFLQIFLLLAVIEIIYHPMTYLFGFGNGEIALVANYLGLDPSASTCQISIIEAIKNGTLTAGTVIAGLDADILSQMVVASQNFQMNFLGINLSIIPVDVWGLYILVPVLAGLSSWVMCWTQNMSNVIQHEQGKLNQYGIMILSVALSLYLGLFVPAGIALYWILSNLTSVGQMYLLNVAINPKKYVDYDALEESRVALAESKAFGQIDKKDPLYKQMKKREKVDYKSFKHVANKHVVFYSEKSGFYKYYKDLIEELIKRSNVVIHYVTNDYNDQIFEIAKTQPRIKPYYISLKKTALLMMLVETDMFLMTTPDLDKYYLKRSFLKKDIEYVYVPHDTMSAHMGFNEGAFDAFDTILCVGQHFVNEIRKTEEVYNLNAKNLVEFGFPLLDELVAKGRKENENKVDTGKKEILIAPSWQEDNLLDSVIDELIANLCCDEYHVTVRPHPEYAKRFKYQLNELVEKYKDYDQSKLSFELDFSANKSIYSADLMITDWSGISAEFCFATQRPAVFINTKIKANNKNWQNLGITPVEMYFRNELGIALDKNQVCDIKQTVEYLFANGDKYKEKIDNYFETFTFNHGTAAQKGAQYILKSLVDKKKNKQN